MRYFLITLGLIAAAVSQADTIDHFMNISNNIPKMQMKADPQSQAWARSARDVLAITTETVAETLLQANELATGQGRPLFCLPPGVTLNGLTMNSVIVNTYNQISSQKSDKDKMTVSQVAWLGVSKTYPCKGKNQHANQMRHVAALLQK